MSASKLRKNLFSITTGPSDFIKVPLNRRDRAAGFIEVKLKPIPDGKYQELESVYIDMLKLQEAAEVAKQAEIQELEARTKRKANSKELLAITKKHAKPINEAQEAFFESKLDLIQWALVELKPFDHFGKTYTLELAKESLEDASGVRRTVEVASRKSLEALKGLELGYGTKRYPLLVTLFDIVFDFQNCYLTDAEVIWSEYERQAQETAVETKQVEQPNQETNQEVTPAPLA